MILPLLLVGVSVVSCDRERNLRLKTTAEALSRGADDCLLRRKRPKAHV